VMRCTAPRQPEWMLAMTCRETSMSDTGRQSATLIPSDTPRSEVHSASHESHSCHDASADARTTCAL
jgi:hypothetical protein